jgi:hypothetical protein
MASLPVTLVPCKFLAFNRSAEELTSNRKRVERAVESFGPVVGLDQAAVAQAAITDADASIKRNFFTVISGSRNPRG